MYKVKILTLAAKDIQEAASWYDKQKSGLGKRFVYLIKKKVNRILLAPHHYEVRYNNVRTAMTDVFPFMIHYTIEENLKTILIIAVLHTSRSPKTWEGSR